MMNKPLNLTPPVVNPNAEKVLSKRYYRKDENGRCVEDATELFWRVASSVAAEEAKYGQSPWKPDALARAFYDMMTDWRFLPNSPTLMNAGSELGQLSACFVLPVGDSIEEIFDAVKFAAMIHKSGGGTGFSFSRLRPKNSRVGTTGGVASGPVSFLRIFNTATEQIKQGGTRRGANMGILRIDHPDILEFIRAKEQDGEFNNFNLSVGITEAFMQAVEQDRDYPLVNPASGKEQGRLNAREVFNLLVDKAWQSGNPGIIFLDRINRDNPTPAQGEIESTNPCGEQPLLPYEACNLGSLNLSSFFVPGHLDETNPADRGIDWAGLERTIALAVRFLDNVVDASQFPLERIAEQVRRNRKIGLGVMGWADLLYQLRIPYDSADAITLAERIMDFIETRGRAASIQLAAERGPFPAYETSVYPTKGIPPLRNATITTIAPTGTLSNPRGLLVRRGTAVRPELRPQRHGRRTPCGSEPALRGSLARNRLLQPAASGRRGGAWIHPEPRPASRRAAPGIRDRDGHRARVASPYAGGFPAPHGQRRVQDRKPAQLGYARRHFRYLLDGL